MQNVTFIKHITAKVSLTPEQWQLYASSMDCSEAAEALNRAAEDAIASSSNDYEALKKLHMTMQKYHRFGACDSEPAYVAEDLMAEAFGKY